PRAAIGGKVFLKALYRLPQNVIAASHGFEHRVFQFWADGAVLAAKVQERDHDASLFVSSSTGKPRLLVDKVAAASISTTRRPPMPSVNGTAPLSMQFANS